MSKDKELELGALESMDAVLTKTPKTPKAPKVVTAEEIQAINDASEKLRMFGVSDKFAKVMELLPVWHDKEAAAPVKASVIEWFGGSEKFKDYIDTEFKNELKVINGMQKCVSVLNSVCAFYARREGTKKVKMTQVNIGGKLYSVNAEYLGTLAGKTRDEKKELLLAHADTKESQQIEVL